MMPMRGIFPCCCARADKGQVAATPLNRVMNSRRLIGFVLKAVDRPYHTGGRKRRFALQRNMAAKVRDGSKREATFFGLCRLPPATDIRPPRLRPQRLIGHIATSAKGVSLIVPVPIG